MKTTMKVAVAASIGRYAAGLAACVLVAPQVALAQVPPPITLGRLMVHVTYRAAPVPNAMVCIGVPGDLDLYYRGMTDSRGNVRFRTVPRGEFVATANRAGRGTQRIISPASPNLPLLNIDLALPANGGPVCPPPTPGGILPPGPRITG